MPDTDDYGRPHPDTYQTPNATWAGAFAALPLEAPAPDSWQRVQERLPMTRPIQRTRWPIWLATAASLALVIAIPLRMQSETIPDTFPSLTTSSPEPVTNPPAVDAGVEVASTPLVSSSIKNTDTGMTLPMQEATARAKKPRRIHHMEAAQPPIRTAAQPADTTRVAEADTTDASASGVNLEALYTQSAQLESLLALARDDRVSSGSAAALTDSLDTQVANIDAALIQPEVSPQGRAALWRDRVDTLRLLVGIETTQRLYAARGQQYDAALVSID